MSPNIGSFSRVGSNRRGATALEFALIAPVLIALSIWIFEFSVLMIRQQAVHYAGMEASRLLRTGVSQTSMDPLTTVRDGMCAASLGLLECAAIGLDVRTFTTFTALEAALNAGDDGTDLFNPGGPRSVMLVEVTFPHRIATPLVGAALDRPVTLRASFVIQGEPWAP